MARTNGSASQYFETSGLKPWEVIKSREVFAASPWIWVSEQEVRVSDGTVVSDYHQIIMGDYVVVFAQTADGRVILERQYKHGVGQITLVLPAGGIEQGEEPLAAAKRELIEETGYAASSWDSLGSFVANGNYGCGNAHLFLAQGAEIAANPDSDDLEETEIILMQPEELLNAVEQHRIVVLGSVTAIGLAMLKLGRTV